MSTGQTICLIILFILGHTLVQCHLANDASTPSNKIDLYCLLAESCVHDIIPICGRQGDEKRTFMDLCDLMEYACDKNQIFTHVDDMEGCPDLKKKKDSK